MVTPDLFPRKYFSTEFAKKATVGGAAATDRPHRVPWQRLEPEQLTAGPGGSGRGERAHQAPRPCYNCSSLSQLSQSPETSGFSRPLPQSLSKLSLSISCMPRALSAQSGPDMTLALRGSPPGRDTDRCVHGQLLSSVEGLCQMWPRGF